MGLVVMRDRSARLIPVLPKNYRSISLRAIEISSNPQVFMDRQAIVDFSSQGSLTQKNIRACTSFEIRDGSVGILGFHDHPREMWINEDYREFARYCEQQGWLRIEDSPC